MWSTPETAREVGHLDGGFGCFGTLVAQGSACAVECLLLVVAGEDAEDDGHLLGGIEVGTALGDIVAHIVEVTQPIMITASNFPLLAI